FDSNGSSDTVRAVTEVAGPGGADPCPAGPNSSGCMMGERIVEEPFMSSSAEWTIPAELPITRSEGSIPAFAPNTFEIRFTETGSLAYQGFTSGRIVRFPIEIWDIGPVPPGAVNDPSDDRRMAVLAFSDGGSECDFNLDEFALNNGQGPTVSDRLYAYYLAAGSSNEDYESAVNDWIPASEELGIALTGEVRACSNGAVGPFGCNAVDLLSYLPFEMLGNSPVNDLWGWTDPQSGREYALVARVDGLSFVDVTDPLNPQYLGQMPTETFGTAWRDVKVYGNTAYVVADNAGGGGLQLFDLTRLRAVSNPPATFNADLVTGDFIGDAHNIAINEESGFLYGALAGGTCGRNGIAMADLANPLNPVFTGCMTFTDPAVQVHDLHCVNYVGPDLDYAGDEICFTANEQDGLGIANVTNKSNPFEIARADYPLLQYAHQGWLTDDHRYFVMGDELDETGFGINTRALIWDVTDLDDPQLATIWESGTTATDHNLYVEGNVVYAANYASGLRLIDISDISNPREIGFFDTFPFDDAAGFDGAWSAYPFFDSGTVAITSRNEGLILVRLVQGVNVVDAKETPTEYRLAQNYPNPFNPSTAIGFSIPETMPVRLAVFDVLGREVAVLVDAVLPAGSHTVAFDAGDLPSGTYVYRLDSGGFSESRQLSLLR
ncbi:MAG: choice-of-anchor B family protein, partial [Rhodothermia bacterium]|nr:choice-of-anchor B family protein [Rhodothermia bacterium]